MHTHHERGIALVLALFLMSAMSVLAASLMFLSQTETYASMNYRMMSQARYGGESAVQKAANFLLDPAQYAVPNGADPLLNPAQCNHQVSPVTCGGQPVILSATAAQASNYPVAAVQTAFNTAAQGSLAAGSATVNYSAYATLIAMQQFDSFGGTQSVVQTWQITGVGALSGGRTATVEVAATVETPKVPANSYGAFAQDDGCGALTFQGNVTIDSYDSTGMAGSTAPTLDDSGGDVGTNGNLSIGGSVEVQGNLYTPRTGVGTCDQGHVNALSETGNAEVSGSTVQLPSEIIYPTPTIPAPSLLSEASIQHADATACPALGLTAANCTINGDNIIIDGHGATLSLPSVRLTGHGNIVLVASSPPAQYNFNSIFVGSQADISTKATSSTQAVIVDVVGLNPDNSTIATPIDMQGGSFAAVNSCTGCSTLCATCSVYDASMLQFVYGGDGEIKMKGNSGAAATFYAPNASVEYGGTSDLYGSVIAHRINEVGSGDIHYDRRLQKDFWVAGHPMASTFSWKRY